ncbi:RagB/SusD family nutrient uptake outer membrane protein [Flavivirga spongiicola]|uniref:RagB/SusD family nutrient uptake outer membrane protein n=1 Tax=Flavivirga spongiicola TaxID=421621 RepID=A0ABU7XSK9_9FLAO|nr:RagB/SusD family nutrient uptake outer membrane protein [Flavivirga sp. MEBiC05379]MDO5978758.1 RagB/SusD family nutrient uptake outer membrane protein [Flavivirga sp. MEBiC05379]
MKKIIKFIFCLALFAGCEDAIDIDQVGRITTDVAFQNLNDLRDGLIGVYTKYDLVQDIAHSSTFTDELSVGFISGGQRVNDYQFILDATSLAAFTFWQRSYEEINEATRLILAAESVSLESEEQEDYNNILGQAHALRAYSHFKLLSYYSTDLTDDNALGVIAVDFVPLISDVFPRNTNGEVFALIEGDLQKAESLLLEQSNATFISKDFVTALRARMATYRGQYSMAATYAQQLLDRYPIASRGQYTNMFLDADNTEIIFKLERTRGDIFDRAGNGVSNMASQSRAGAKFAFTNETINGGPYFEIGRSLFNLFDQDDIRFDVNVGPESIISPDYQNAADFENEDILLVHKYPGSETQPLMNDLKVFRSSEMLLILAEAAADGGNINGAANSTSAYIKQLRDARFTTVQPLPTYANETEAFAAILNERRIELAFEGHRFHDLKRLGVRANQDVLRDPLDCNAIGVNGACSLPATDHRFTLPIPQAELIANPNIREQQNSGY